MVASLEKLINEPIQVRNSLDGNIERSGFFRIISNYLRRGNHTITKYKKPALCVTAAATLIFLVGAFKKIYAASSYVDFAVSKPCGWIVFGSSRDGDGDIWAIRPDGTGLHQLIDMPGHQDHPQWSPDSTKIAYSSEQDAQIWVYNWFTGTNTKVYDGDNYGSYGAYLPAWSPDGSKILFREDASYNNPHITVINADGTGRAIVPVQSGYVDGPSWSPTRTAFVYMKRNAGPASNDLWIYDFTATGDILNGVNHRLTAGASGESTTKIYDWAPSEDIVFSWGHNIAIIDPGKSPSWVGACEQPVGP